MPAMPSRSLLFCAGRRAAWLLPALALAGLLAACGAGNEEKFAPACPGLALLPDAGDLTRFTGDGRDVTNLVIRARITKVPASCEADKPDVVRATLHVEADLRRGPATGATPAPVGYFVALMEQGRVLREQDFALAPKFAPNDDYASVHGDDIELLLPVSKTKSAAAYQIYVGFRLTPDELAYNRAHPRP
jgi:hypothetical protein